MKNEQEDMLKALVKRMMHDVYHMLSACVWLDEAGKIRDLYLFDTLYSKPEWPEVTGASECFLISNHFDGGMHPFDEDIRNLNMLRKAHPQASCHLMIYSEYEDILKAKDV